MSAWLLSLLFLGCSADPPAPADISKRLASALGMDGLTRAPLVVSEGKGLDYPSYTVRPVRLDVFEDFRISGALWLPKSAPPFPTLLMAHGHFGEGKSSGESQAPAHVMAERGWAVLALDTPGVEEGDLPGRQIHHADGAHNRAVLAAAGTSAMALQLHGLQAALDYLQTREDVSSISVGGASGGAVQALYLARIDPRPNLVLLASFVPMPREAQAGGCACDTVPGWPGPDPTLLENMTRPSLWLSELVQPAPAGLPESATFEIIKSHHGFAPEMIQRAADWLDEKSGRTSSTPLPSVIPHTPSTSLASSDLGSATVFDLVRNTPKKTWKPNPAELIPHIVECTGRGSIILVAGGDSSDEKAILDTPLVDWSSTKAKPNWPPPSPRSRHWPTELRAHCNLQQARSEQWVCTQSARGASLPREQEFPTYCEIHWRSSKTSTRYSIHLGYMCRESGGLPISTHLRCSRTRHPRSS